MSAKKRLALGIEYDGQAWCGWQTQPHRKTIQDQLEAALRTFVGPAVQENPIATICAGRTDTGVHATAQVVHFDTSVQRPLHAWVRAANAHLPDSIAVRWVREVTPDFNARFSATMRRYEYWLYTDPVRTPRFSGRVAWHYQTLDVNAMQAAAQCLLGEQDFSAFRSAECQANSPIRTLHELNIESYALPSSSGSGALLRFTLQANAFLHHMVRNLVGTLVYVGSGRQPASWVAEVLASRNRGLAAPTFAPDGLYLTQVEYGAEHGVPTAAISPFFAPLREEPHLC